MAATKYEVLCRYYNVDMKMPITNIVNETWISCFDTVPEKGNYSVETFEFCKSSNPTQERKIQDLLIYGNNSINPKFNMFFIQDVKHNSTATIVNNVIKFEDGTIYEYKSNSIYRNDKEIAANVKSATFNMKTYKVENTTKNLILVNLNIGEGEKEYQKEIEYVLRYW